MKATNKKITTNLKRAKSMLKKIEEMIEKDVYCIDVVQQVLATQGILKSLNMELLENHLNSCFSNAMKAKNVTRQREMIEELSHVLRIAQNK